MKIVFPLIGHRYQIPHSLPIAAALARRYPHVQVHLAGITPQHLAFARGLLVRHAGAVPLHYDLLPAPWLLRMNWRWRKSGTWKTYLLHANRHYFGDFDALVTPERTSLYLRRKGLFDGPMIYTTHGAGDREVSVTSELREFDFVLLAGRKHARRLLDLQLIRPGHYESGIYAKLDWMRGEGHTPPRLFDNDRPTVFYNPHFSPAQSSWPLVGRRILEQFAASRRFNLVFAPHVRLFDPPKPAHHRAFADYLGLPHLHIDLGSDRSIDMTYTLAADLYLGDVSSQVVEFLARPRPCLFVNPRGVDWQRDASYRFWRMGPVIDSADDIESHIDRALATHGAYLDAQTAYLADTFGEFPLPSATAERGADAIVAFLQR